MNEKLNIIEARKMPSYTEFKVLYDCGHYDKRTIKKLPNGFFEWSELINFYNRIESETKRSKQ